MQINIDCSCGTQYQLEVEPVDGRVPSTVLCPHCNTDGTEAADEYIQMYGDPHAATRPRVSAPPATVESIPAARRAAPSSIPNIPAGRNHPRGPATPNLVMGAVGAAAAGLLGMLIWYLLIKWTNTEFGMVAWGVGGLTGLGCRLLSRGSSSQLGIIAGLCAFLAIVGGELLATHSAYRHFLGEFLATAYQEQMAYAQRAIKVKTDTEVRAFLVAEREDPASPAVEPTDEEVREFNTVEVPKLQEFIAGQPSQPEFEAMLRDNFNSFEIQATLLKESFSLWTLLWLFLGVGTAHRLGKGETA